MPDFMAIGVAVGQGPTLRIPGVLAVAGGCWRIVFF